MFFKKSVLITFSFFLSVCFAESQKANQENQVQLIENSIIDIKASNVRKNRDHYTVDIFADNIDKSIAGIQFNLIGEDFTVIEVNGGLAESAGFNFYNGAKGVILAFSLEGRTISASKVKTPLLVLKVQKNIKGSAELNFKTLIAGERGVKLDSKFKSIVIK